MTNQGKPDGCKYNPGSETGKSGPPLSPAHEPETDDCENAASQEEKRKLELSYRIFQRLRRLFYRSLMVGYEKGRDANLAEWIMAFAAVAMLLTSYLQWTAIKGQLHEAQRQFPQLKESADAAKGAAAIAKQELELSERPWISAQVFVAGPFTFDKSGAYGSFVFVLRNSGRSPAVGVEVWPELFVENTKGPSSFSERKRLCKEHLRTSRNFGQTVFPGAPFTEKITTNINEKDIARSSLPIHPHGRVLAASLIYCVSYSPSFNPKLVYQTSAVYMVGRANPSNPNVQIAILVGHNVPPKLLSLELMPFGSSAR